VRQALMATMLGGWPPGIGSSAEEEEEASFRVWLSKELRVVASCWALVRLCMAAAHLGRR
jgi:hypothetical protein